MALVTYGAGVVQMSGSVAGVVHARNRFGNYIRPRTKPVNPMSFRQTKARATLMLLAEQWHESPMTDPKRGAWITYANSINWLNRLGVGVKLTGFDHFCRSNAARMACALALISDGPTVLSLPETDNTVTVTGSQATQKITVTFNNTHDWASETGGALSIQMGCPQLATRTFFKGPFRWSGKILGVDASPPSSPQTIDPAFVLVKDQKVWCKVSIIRKDGRVSNYWSPAPFVCGA